MPPLETPPEQGSPLYRLLVQQQVRSMTPRLLLRLMRRVMADQRVNDRLSRSALPGLMTRIDAGVPQVLVIVRTRGAESPAKNHQVLCVGYDLDERLSHMRLDLYDPIYPCQLVALHAELASLDGALHLEHTHGDRVRGIFVA